MIAYSIWVGIQSTSTIMLRQDLHEGGANHNPDYGTRSSSEATPAQNGGGNGVKLIKIPEINRLGGIDAEDEKQTAQA